MCSVLGSSISSIVTFYSIAWLCFFCCSSSFTNDTFDSSERYRQNHLLLVSKARNLFRTCVCSRVPSLHPPSRNLHNHMNWLKTLVEEEGWVLEVVVCKSIFFPFATCRSELVRGRSYFFRHFQKFVLPSELSGNLDSSFFRVFPTSPGNLTLTFFMFFPSSNLHFNHFRINGMKI